MAQSAPARAAAPTKSPQPARIGARRPGTKERAGRLPAPAFPGGSSRAATRGEDRAVIELEFGITVYPPQPEPEGTGKKNGRLGGGRCGTRTASGSSASR